MLSERQLSRGFRPWWQQWTPGLTNLWLQQMQKGILGSHKVHQWGSIINTEVATSDADLISETAFGLVAQASELRTSIHELTQETRVAVVKSSTHRIMLLRGSGRDLTGQMTSAHLEESLKLADRLSEWMKKFPSPIEIQPRLQGLGFVNACHPDMIAGSELIEVKMSRSVFRLDDIRQVLIYAALIWRGTERELTTLTLTNPRLGLDWKIDLRQLIKEISNQPISHFFEKFEFMTQTR